jgi:hypothetical protein
MRERERERASKRARGRERNLKLIEFVVIKNAVFVNIA